MNERFWTTKDPDYWHLDRDDRNAGGDNRHYDDRRRDERYNERDFGRYGEHDPSFYYGGFRDQRHMGRIYNGENYGPPGYWHNYPGHNTGTSYGRSGSSGYRNDQRNYSPGREGSSRRRMEMPYDNENFGASGYDHTGFRSSRRNYGNDRYRNEGSVDRGGSRDQDPGFYEDERFGEYHQHRYHARTSDDWDRPAAYNRGGFGRSEFGSDNYVHRDRMSLEGGRSYDDPGYRGQGYEETYRWRGW